MRTIQKGQEPNSLLEYRKNGNTTYGEYTEKQDIRLQLVSEQRGLCCYCQSRIRATHDGMKIEHWQSQSADKYPARQLDYTNMLGSCLGGQKNGEKSPKGGHHCDTSKGDADLCFCLTDIDHPVERLIRFLGDGRIVSEDVAVQTNLDEILNLNLDILKSNRKAVLTAFQQRLDAGKPLDVDRELPNWDGSQAVELPQFAQVVVYWLKKKQARVPK